MIGIRASKTITVRVLAALIVLAAVSARAAEESPSSLYLTGIDKFYSGQYGPARELFERVYSEFPESEEARDAVYKTAESYFREGDFQKAGSFFRLFADLYPLHKNARDAKTRLASCEEKTGAAIPSARIVRIRKPIRHLAVLSNSLPVSSEEELRRTVAGLAASGVTTIIVSAHTRPGDNLHALVQNPDNRQGVYFQTDRTPAVADVLAPLGRIARGMKLRVLATISVTDLPWLFSEDRREADGVWDAESRTVKPGRRLDPFNEEAMAKTRGLLEDLARAPIDGIIMTGFESSPAEGLSAPALEAFQKSTGGVVKPESFFPALAGSVTSASSATEAYAPYAEFKARRLSELAGFLASALKGVNGGLQVFAEVRPDALTDAPDALAAHSQDARALLKSGVDGLFIVAPWRAPGIKMPQPGAAAQSLEALSRACAALSRDPYRFVIALPIEEPETRKFFPDWEIREAVSKAASALPAGIALFPLALDFPYNQYFGPLLEGDKKKESR